MDKLKEIWYKVYDKLLFPIEKFFRQLKLTWDWYRAILKDDCDFDHTYIYKVIRYKLERTRKKIQADDFVMSAGRTAKEIRTAELILDRLIQNDYCRCELDSHDEKWGELEIEWKPIENSRFIRSIFYRGKANTLELEEKEGKERRRIYEHEEYMRNQDLDYLFGYMRRKIQGWWD
jgi:hypothetical protein